MAVVHAAFCLEAAHHIILQLHFRKFHCSTQKLKDRVCALGYQLLDPVPCFMERWTAATIWG